MSERRRWVHDEGGSYGTLTADIIPGNRLPASSTERFPTVNLANDGHRARAIIIFAIPSRVFVKLLSRSFVSVKDVFDVDILNVLLYDKFRVTAMMKNL